MDAISKYEMTAQNCFMALANNLHANAIRRIARDIDDSTIAQAIEATAHRSKEGARGGENDGIILENRDNVQNDENNGEQNDIGDRTKNASDLDTENGNGSG